jgi:hypothetical protein
MRMEWKTLLAAAGLLVATQAAAQITFYEAEGFRGRALTAEGTIPDMHRFGFNDRAASAVVAGGRWEVCDDAFFAGRCVVLSPGSYGTFAGMNMNYRIASVRPVGEAVVQYQAPAVVAPAPAVVAPAPAVTYVRPEDQRFDARVISARAVFTASGRQCWVEPEQIGPLELPGAIIAGVGDLLTGRQRATYFEHCATVPAGRPDYWDVAYEFRGTERHVQLRVQPGPTIAVNGNGDMIG